MNNSVWHRLMHREPVRLSRSSIVLKRC